MAVCFILLTRSTEGLELNRWGYIVADPETEKTSIEGVWAGCDTVTGSATVIEAMGAGRRAARSIHEYLTRKQGVSLGLDGDYDEVATNLKLRDLDGNRPSACLRRPSRQTPS